MLLLVGGVGRTGVVNGEREDKWIGIDEERCYIRLLAFLFGSTIISIPMRNFQAVTVRQMRAEYSAPSYLLPVVALLLRRMVTMDASDCGRSYSSSGGEFVAIIVALVFGGV